MPCALRWQNARPDRLFQYAVVGNLLRQTFAAAESFGARGIVVSGGVAANSELRRRFQAEADRRGLPVAFPSLALSTDNAAMIAAAAWPKFVAGDFAAEDLGATPQLRLGSASQKAARPQGSPVYQLKSTGNSKREQSAPRHVPGCGRIMSARGNDRTL